MIISTVVMVQYRLLIEYDLMTRMSKHKAKAPQRRVINRGNKNYNSHNLCTEVDLLVDESENPTSVLEK